MTGRQLTGKTAGRASPRPLARSLEPLTGESLAGYLLRLSYRLRITPLQLARLTGCTSETSPVIRRQLLLDLDVQRFAQATRLTVDEAAALTLMPWADRYPPIARSRSGSSWRAAFDDWLFNNSPRYCPGCLAGDGSPVQQQYGGPWKKIWHLPIAFACPEHHLFLHEDCPRLHPPDAGISRLIIHTSGSALHPAQCRRSENPARRPGRHRPSCGTRLDQPAQSGTLYPTTGMLDAQQRLLTLLDPQRPAEDAVRGFTDLRVATALLCATWPFGRDLADPGTAVLITEYVRQLDNGRRRAHDRPPQDTMTAAGLLTAATAILDNPDLQHAQAQHLQASWPGRPSRSPLAQTLTRHEPACSEPLREAIEPATRAYRRRTGSHGTKAPARTSGYRPEHIPAFLEHDWYQQHLAALEYGHTAKSLRRAGAVTLVQWAAGGSLGDAATFLGINPKDGNYAFTSDLYRWLANHQARFITALKALAAGLDTKPGLIDYQHRREALRNWCLPAETWDEIVKRLPPVPGPVQPVLDDRKRQEASAFIWARLTQGEPRFAPRPIEAGQPDHVRQAWRHRRGTAWHHLSRPHPLAHYAALRKLLIQHADHLAGKVDNGAEASPCVPSH